MLLLPLLIVLAWSAALLVVAGLCVAACRGDAEPAEWVRVEPEPETATAPGLQPVPVAPPVGAHESPARIAA
jgi:hypothetical protein